MTTCPKKIVQVFLLLAISAATTASQADFDSDRALAKAVHDRLVADESVEATLIGIAVRDGVVKLSGSAPHLLSKERAEAIAESMRGVRSVVNKIAVIAEPRTDQEIHFQILEALQEDSATEPYEAEVSVEDGQVTLTGKVDSMAEKELAEVVVKRVRGVLGVTNRIEVRPTDSRPDEEILADVERRLATDLQIQDELIDVRVEDGRVIVSGKVASLAEKRRVRRVAWVAGAQSIDASGLEISLVALDSLEPPAPGPTNYAEIERAIYDAFRYDPRLKHFAIDVKVKAGTATLSGQVTSLYAKQAAENDALNTRGVVVVKNQLDVVPSEPRSDAELVQAVQRALERDADLFEQKIRVQAEDGIVTLSGHVPTLFLRREAAEVAAGARGALAVQNDLRVDAEKTDEQIKYYIVNSLYWDPNITDRDQVNVLVDKGKVRLTGTVHNQTARRAAYLTAQMSGAHSVDNQLKIGW